MNLTQQSKLTPRQWALYNLVKDRTIAGLKTTCKDICEALPEHYTLNEKQSHHSNCPHIYQDCDALLLSSEVEKPIIVDNNDFHIARNEEEAMAYAKKLAKRGAHRFKRYWAIVDKCKSDGQGKLISCHGDVIEDDSKARRFVEAFLDTDDKEREDGGNQ